MAASTCRLQHPTLVTRANTSQHTSVNVLYLRSFQKATSTAARRSSAARAVATEGWTMQGKHEDEGWVKVEGCYDATPSHNFHSASEHVFTSGQAIASACEGLSPAEIEVQVFWCDESNDVDGVPVCHGWSPDVGPIDLPKDTVPKGFSPTH